MVLAGALVALTAAVAPAQAATEPSASPSGRASSTAEPLSPADLKGLLDLLQQLGLPRLPL